MYFPSGVQTGKEFNPGRKLSFEGVGRSKSFTQMSAPLPLFTENTSRLPSGEKRGPRYWPGGSRSVGWEFFRLSIQEIGHPEFAVFCEK